MRGALGLGAGIGFVVLYAMGCADDSRSTGQNMLSDAMVADGHHPSGAGGASGRDSGRGNAGATPTETGGSQGTGGAGAGGVSADGAIGGSRDGSLDAGRDASGQWPVDGSSGEGSADGGADGGSTLSDYRSGTRLRAMVYEVPGVRVWHGWFDRQLGVECAFVPAEDSKIRCLPTARVNRYGSPGCTINPIGYVGDGGCALPKFVTGRVDDCGTAATYTLGTSTTISNAYPVNPFPNGKGCVGAQKGTEQGYGLVKQAPSDFVAATLVVEARSADLGVSYYQADDGARQPVAPYDLNRAHACDPAALALQFEPEVASYANRCIPSPTALAGNNSFATPGGGLFSDNACQDLLGFVNKCLANEIGAIKVEKAPEIPTGGFGNTAFSLANVGPPPTVISQLSTLDQCSLVTDTSSPYWQSRSYFEVGSTIAPSDLPLVNTVDVGTDRVKARYYASSDGKLLTFVGFYDSTLGLRCSATVTDDAGARCFPDEATRTLYTDDQCTTPTGIGNSGGEVPAYEYSEKGVVCGLPTRALWRTGSEFTPTSTLYTWRLDIPCTEWFWVPSFQPVYVTLSPVASATLGGIRDSTE